MPGLSAYTGNKEYSRSQGVPHWAFWASRPRGRQMQDDGKAGQGHACRGPVAQCIRAVAHRLWD